MKKAAVVLSILILGSIQVFSQYRTLDNDEYELYNNETRDLIKHAKENEKITITKTNKKEKVYHITSYKFNQNKKMISWIVKGKSDKEKSKRLMDYQDKHLLSKEIYKKGKLKYKTKNTFDGDYNIAYTKFNRSNDILYKRTTTYTDKEYKILAHKNSDTPFWIRKKTKSTITYKKGGTKQANRWEYEYDGDGERTKSTMFGKKNEIKHVWDYTCKTEGELIKVKNETQQCKWEEIENGMLVKVTRTTSPKGKIKKTIQKYDADTNIIESSTYNDNVLIYKGTYNGDFFKALTWESYHKGKLKVKHEYTYKGNGKAIGYKTYWGKNMATPKREVKYSYEKDRLATVITFMKGEATSTSKITYN